MDDVAARRALMSLGTPGLGRQELRKIGSALDRTGAAFAGGATPTWVGDVLEVAPRATWRGALDKTQKENSAPYVALWTRFEEDGNGFRSFEPGDLPDDAEGPLRDVARSTKNDAVAGRVFDVLWVRFKRAEDTSHAVHAYLRQQERFSGCDDWHDLVQVLGRATTLITLRKDAKKLADVIGAFESAGARILAGDRTYGFGPLADALLATIIENKWARAHFDNARADRWITTLQMLATVYELDQHHGQDALTVLEGWLARLGRTEERKAVRRTKVEHLIRIAQRQPAAMGAHYLERALSLAMDLGIADLVEHCRTLLGPAIQAASAQMKPIKGMFTVPSEITGVVDDLLRQAPSLSVAIRELALLPGLLEAPVDIFEEAATQRLKDSPFWVFAQSVHYRDGKVSFQASDREAKWRESIGQSANFHLLVIEGVLLHFVRRVHDQLTEKTFFDAVAVWPLLRQQRMPLLLRASERCAARDWISAGFILGTVYEALLRDLLRAGGYHALKGDSSGILMDETLASLLQRPHVRSTLGEKHVWLVEHVLCRADLGPNLRNEIAHGNVDPSELTPARIVLIWLFIARITCYIPAQSNTSVGSAADTDEEYAEDPAAP